MKSKKLSKKLKLNKKTIAHLNDSEKKAVHGGCYTPYSCPTLSYHVCCD